MRPLDWIAWFFSFACVLGFFLPWMKIEPLPQDQAARRSAVAHEVAQSETGSWAGRFLGLGAHERKEALAHPFEGVSGFQFPRLFVEKRLQREAGALRESGLLGRERLADRAYFAYALPAAAFLAACFLFACTARKWPLLLPLAGCAGLYGAIRWQWDACLLDRAMAGLQAGPGLWVCAYALLGLGLLLAARLVLPSGGRL